jgi:hypothetical protein
MTHIYENRCRRKLHGLVHKTHLYIWWSRWVARHFVKQPQAKSIYREVYYGATNPNVVFAYSMIFSSDATKSRRCAMQFLKLVVAIYVVEY